MSQTNAGTFGFLPQFGLLTLQEENLVPVSEFVFTKVGGGLFTLDGLTLTSFVRIQGTTLLGIQFQGFVNGVLKAVDVFKNTGEFVTEFVSSFNFSGVPIDELRFSFDNLVTGAAIQSFTVDTNVAVVPEPSTALLLGLGLAGLAGKGRRRNRS
ncbi:MAG: PEP-CTERM sorting domain-containing protein [Myxococcota bacterium]